MKNRKVVTKSVWAWVGPQGKGSVSLVNRWNVHKARAKAVS